MNRLMMVVVFVPMSAWAVAPEVRDCGAGDRPSSITETFWNNNFVNTCTYSSTDVCVYTGSADAYVITCDVPGTTANAYLTEAVNTEPEWQSWGTFSDTGTQYYCCAIADDDSEVISFTFRGSSGADSLRLEDSTAGLEMREIPSSSTQITVTVEAEAGADEIWGSPRDNRTVYKDKILGSSGADTIHAGLATTEVDGGTDDDTIYGSGNIDDIVGGPGEDWIEGRAGDDILRGDVEVDCATAGDDDTIMGGAGNDTIYGCDGADMLIGDSKGVGFSCLAFDGEDSISGGAGNDQIRGCDGDDLLLGGGGADEIWGGDDEDTIVGGGGADEIHGEDQDDNIHGGAGDDVITGGNGVDILDGDGDDDVICDDDASDVYLGGDGDDTIWHDDGSTTPSGLSDAEADTNGDDCHDDSEVANCEYTIGTEPTECSGFTY